MGGEEMIYRFREGIPADHPRDAACIMPEVCGICGSRPPRADYARLWMCEVCMRPFFIGLRVGDHIGFSQGLRMREEATR